MNALQLSFLQPLTVTRPPIGTQITRSHTHTGRHTNTRIYICVALNLTLLDGLESFASWPGFHYVLGVRVKPFQFRLDLHFNSKSNFSIASWTHSPTHPHAHTHAYQYVCAKWPHTHQCNSIWLGRTHKCIAYFLELLDRFESSNSPCNWQKLRSMELLEIWNQFILNWVSCPQNGECRNSINLWQLHCVKSKSIWQRCWAGLFQ